MKETVQLYCFFIIQYLILNIWILQNDHGLLNIHHRIQHFFLWCELFRSTLSNFQICKGVLLTASAILYLTSIWVNYFNWKFVAYDPLHNSPYPQNPAFGNHQCVLWIYELVCCLNFICKWDHTLFVFLSDLFHLAS